MSFSCHCRTLLPFACSHDFFSLSVMHAGGHSHDLEFFDTYRLCCEAFFECFQLFAAVFCLTYASWSAGTPRLTPVCALIDRSTRLVEPYCSLFLSRASSTPGAVPSAASHDSFSRVLSLHLRLTCLWTVRLTTSIYVSGIGKRSFARHVKCDPRLNVMTTNVIPGNTPEIISGFSVIRLLV